LKRPPGSCLPEEVPVARGQRGPSVATERGKRPCRSPGLAKRTFGRRVRKMFPSPDAAKRQPNCAPATLVLASDGDVGREAERERGGVGVRGTVDRENGRPGLFVARGSSRGRATLEPVRSAPRRERFVGRFAGACKTDPFGDWRSANVPVARRRRNVHGPVPRGRFACFDGDVWAGKPRRERGGRWVVAGTVDRETSPPGFLFARGSSRGARCTRTRSVNARAGKGLKNRSPGLAKRRFGEASGRCPRRPTPPKRQRPVGPAAARPASDGDVWAGAERGGAGVGCRGPVDVSTGPLGRSVFPRVGPVAVEGHDGSRPSGERIGRRVCFVKLRGAGFDMFNPSATSPWTVKTEFPGRARSLPARETIGLGRG